MASEEHEEASVTTTLPTDLDRWLEEQASATGLDRGAFLRQLLAAHRAASDGQDDGELPPAVEDALANQREEFSDLLEDVRKRVVQVKRETDAKAPADHDHPELSETVAALEAELDGLEGAVADVEADLEAGFGNYRDVLTALTEATEIVEDRMDVLARAVLDAREELRRQAAREVARREAERLQLAANREGLRSAVCEECETSVEIGLLSKPECPHCASTFTDVESKRGFFGSDRLLTGDPPALEGSVGGDLDDDLDDLVADAEAATDRTDVAAPPRTDAGEDDE